MNKTAGRIIIIVFVFATLYYILRYNIFKGVEWAHFPLFMLNMGLDPIYRGKGKEWFVIRKFLGRTGMMMIVIHTIMSLLLFRPEVYDKFFNPDGTLNAMGEWSMLLGSLGIAAYIIMHNSFSNPEEGNRFQNWIRSPFFGITALVLSTFHISVIGFSGWLTPREWYGGMPSISLLSALFFIIAMVLVLSGRKKNQQNHSLTKNNGK